MTFRPWRAQNAFRRWARSRGDAPRKELAPSGIEPLRFARLRGPRDKWRRRVCHWKEQILEARIRKSYKIHRTISARPQLALRNAHKAVPNYRRERSAAPH